MSGFYPPASERVPCPEGESRCVECGECKNDPSDFYDGLRCITCCERDEPEEGWDE